MTISSLMMGIDDGQEGPGVGLQFMLSDAENRGEGLAGPGGF